MKGLAFKAPSGVLLHPQPKVPRGILEPRSAGARIHALERGSHWRIGAAQFLNRSHNQLRIIQSRIISRLLPRDFPCHEAGKQ